MTDIITTLHPENDAETNLYPNIKKENIPNEAIDRSKLDESINELLDNIGELHPAGVDTSTNILAKTSDTGIWIGSDTGKWYYWNGTQYVSGGTYQATAIGEGSVTLDSFGADVNDKIGAFNYTFETYLGSTIVTAAFGTNPQQTRQTSISVNLLANKTYTFRIADYPNSSINFYTGSDYSSGYFGTDKRFLPTMKEFTYTPTENITTLYLYCWADIKTYSFIISSDDGVIYDNIDKIDTRIKEVIYPSEATYLSDSIVKKHSASSLLTDGTITSGNINSYVSDFISLNEYDLKEIIYGFYAATGNIAGICCYESNNEVSFIKSYRDYDTINANGWARGVTIPSFPINANYIRFSGRNDQAAGSPSLKVVQPLPKINAEKIENIENQLANMEAFSKPKPIIFDTDFGGDIDDLTALALLLWSERIGLVDIVGIVSCGARSGTYEGTAYNEISAMDAVCNYFGVSDMAFGRNTAMATKESNYCGTCCKWQHSITDLTNIQDSPAFYRRALTSLPEGEKCNVVVVGQTTAFSRFLSSTADKYSNLSGVELARAKIDKLVIMGGNYPNGDKETNFSAYGATPYTYNILENYPNEIIFVGNEMSGIHCGDILLDENLTWSMLYQAMNEFMVAAYNNGDNPWGYTSLEQTWHGKTYAWDCIAVMLACDNNLSISGFRTIRGTCSINNDSESADYGKNSWVDDPTGKHYYVRRQDLRTNQWVTHRFDSIIKEDAWISRVLGRVRLPRNE